MTRYTLTDNPLIVTRDDGFYVPLAEGNRDYAEYLEWVTAGNTPDPVPAPAIYVPVKITRRQFAKGLMQRGIISGSEAVAFLTVGTLPASLEALVASLPANGQDNARIDLQAAEFYRSHYLVEAFGAAKNMSSDDIDDFFIDCGAL